MTEQGNITRRMAYLRWRLKEGKELTEEQRKELNAYDAENTGAYAETLDRLSFDDIGTLARLKADELIQLAQDAQLLKSEDERPTKDAVIERIKTFRLRGLVVARRQVKAA